MRQPQTEPDSSEAVQPIPPRYWWLKRVAVPVIVIVLVLGGLRWWWGEVASRALRAEIDRYVAAGQPVFPEDFDLPGIPDDQNAALLLNQAIKLFQPTKEQSQLISDALGSPDRIAERRDDVEDLLEASAEARALVRAARALPAADWGFRAVSLSSTVPSLIPHESVMRMLLVAALHAHHRGNDMEAVETCRDLLAYGQHVSSLRMLLGSLLDHGASDLLSRVIERIGPSLLISQAPSASSGPSRPAGRAQAEALLADLLDERSLKDGLTWGFYRERTCSVEAISLVTGRQTQNVLRAPSASPRSSTSASAFVLRPMVELDGVWLLRRQTALVEATLAETWPETQRRLPPAPPQSRWRGLAFAAHGLSAMLTPTLFDTIEKVFQPRARRRMAATALAIRLYEIDHSRRPATLNELVPAYLPEVPNDPLADGPRPIGYLPDEDPPLLFSIAAAHSADGKPVGKLVLRLGETAK